MSLVIFTFLLCIYRALLKSSQNMTGICTLTGKESTDPFPSLTNACCTSVHDDYIYTAISNLLTNSCMRKYTELEELMCLGCHPYESSYVDRENRKVFICNAFSMKMWNASNVEELSKGSRKYDNYGFKITPALAELQNTRAHYIIPSETFGGFLEMINAIKIPFYEDYTVELVDEQQTNSTICFNNSNVVIVSFMYISYYCFNIQTEI